MVGGDLISTFHGYSQLKSFLIRNIFLGLIVWYGPPCIIEWHVAMMNTWSRHVSWWSAAAQQLLVYNLLASTDGTLSCKQTKFYHHLNSFPPPTLRSGNWLEMVCIWAVRERRHFFHWNSASSQWKEKYFRDLAQKYFILQVVAPGSPPCSRNLRSWR